MRRPFFIHALLLAGSLALLGCEDGLFTGSDDGFQARLVIDLRALQASAEQAADPCPWVLAEAVLRVAGTPVATRSILPGDTGVTFDRVAVDAGDEIRVEIRSANNHLLSEGIQTVTQAIIDQKRLRIRPNKLLPALEVCPATAVADPHTWTRFFVRNSGADGLSWDVDAAFCQGQPCADSLLTTGQNLAAEGVGLLDLYTSRAAEGQRYTLNVASFYNQGGQDEVPISIDVNTCIDFDALPLFTVYGSNTADPGDLIFTENATPVFIHNYVQPDTTLVFGDIIIVNAQSVGRGRVAAFDNAALEVRFTTTPIRYVRFGFAENGESVNFSVNDAPVVTLGDFTNPLPTPPGINTAVAATNNRGIVTVATDTETITSLRIGGQALTVDAICFGEQAPTPPPSF